MCGRRGESERERGESGRRGEGESDGVGRERVVSGWMVGWSKGVVAERPAIIVKADDGMQRQRTGEDGQASGDYIAGEET